MKELVGKVLGDVGKYLGERNLRTGLGYSPTSKFEEFLTIWFGKFTFYEYKARCPGCGQQKVKWKDEENDVLTCISCREVFGKASVVIGDRLEDDDYI